MWNAKRETPEMLVIEHKLAARKLSEAVIDRSVSGLAQLRRKSLGQAPGLGLA